MARGGAEVKSRKAGLLASWLSRTLSFGPAGMRAQGQLSGWFWLAGSCKSCVPGVRLLAPGGQGQCPPRKPGAREDAERALCRNWAFGSHLRPGWKEPETNEPAIQNYVCVLQLALAAIQQNATREHICTVNRSIST